MDQDATWYGGRPRPTRHCAMETQLPSPKGAQPPNFRPISVVAKRLDGLRWHLVWREASAQATLYSMGTKLPPEKRAHPPHIIFGPCLLWSNGWIDEDVTWYGSRPRPSCHIVLDGVPTLRERGTAPPLFSAYVYCGHGRPSQLLLSSCWSIN